MDTSIYIARIMAIAYLSISIAMFVDPKFYTEMIKDFFKAKHSLYLGGLMALIIGYVIIASHNIWTGWPIIITLLGWMALFKGVFLLAFPNTFINLTKKMFDLKAMPKYRLLVLLLGVIFSYFGFLI